MDTINVNLRGGQVLKICDALNTEAGRIENLITSRRNTPDQAKQIWREKAKVLRDWSKTLIGASSKNDHNPHVPVILHDPGDDKDE
ncbi:hypothetical protein LCGC14_0354830 [marine sediment metagenome]|uniref:Uncharacterized protein n=1 Tax=marine sediment metagenome TaxID=412755 RepID=A0A0F9WHQ4_9ZZZZ